MAKPVLPAPTPADIIEKLHGFAPVLVRGALKAMTLHETWNGLNTDNAARKAIVVSPVTKVIGVMWEASLDSLILVLMRLLDSHGRGSVHDSDRVSFPVIRSLVDEPGVLEMLIGDAESKDGPGDREAKGQAVLDAAFRLRQRLDTMADEEPNRLNRLRSVRDRFLAHQLHMETPLDPPIFGNLRTMVEDVLLLAEDTKRMLNPTVIVWPRGEVTAQMIRLIDTVAQRFPIHR
jgi:hypothetical protein